MGFFYLVDILLLSGAFLFGCAFAGIESTDSFGSYVGASLALIVGEVLIGWIAFPLIGDIEHETTSMIVRLTITWLSAFLTCQLLARWIFSADFRQANIISLAVATGQLAITFFWRWAMS